MDNSKDNRGGAREGAGRKALSLKRKTRSMKAFDEEWEIINKFASKLKKGEISHKTLEKLDLIK